MSIILMGLMGCINIAFLGFYIITGFRYRKMAKNRVQVSDAFIELLKE